MDGLCLGIDVAGEKQKEQIQVHCNNYIQMIMSQICSSENEWRSTIEGGFVQTKE